MPELVRCRWPGGGYGARKDRVPFTFSAFVPDPIAKRDFTLSGAAGDAVARATGALTELEASGVGHDLEVLAGPLLRAEALGSSFIEGLRASSKRVALATYEPVASDMTARAVLGNVRAMELATTTASRVARFRLDDLLDIHRTLLDRTTEARFAGHVRTDQNWIGGRSYSPAGAAFIPPPPARVPTLLNDLVRFTNRSDLPAVAQAAIAHAQFETIHPFGDGNGRTGRCLMHVIFRRRAVTPHFVPPVSVVLAANAKQYVRGLVDFREERIEDWIGTFADATTQSARAARSLWNRVDALLMALIERAGTPRKDAVARKIIVGLPAQPIVSAETAAARHGVTPTAAREALNRLQAVKVLVAARVGRRRDREWMSEELFQLLDAFENFLGDPGSSTGVAAPRSRRPQKR